MLIGRSVHPLPGEAERKERLLALIDGFGNRRVLVVGDIIVDEFIYGEVSRVSREAPVLILKYDATEVVAGGAGNAANNVAALGGRARLAGIVGGDPEGQRLIASLPRGVARTHIVRSRQYRTPVTALFGPTDERVTGPRAAVSSRSQPVVLTHPVWCSPCRLRECPIGHACMRGIALDAVAGAVRRML